MPINLRTGGNASSTNEATWVDYATACRDFARYGCDGVGLCVTAGWTFVDLDGVLDETGKLRSDEYPWARVVVSELRERAYVEISPSGRGLHLYTRGELPPGERVRHIQADGDKVGFELFDKGKYFCVTGHPYDDCNGHPQPCSKRLARLHGMLFPPADVPAAPPKTNGHAAATAAVQPLDDEQLLARARSAHNGSKFATLFDAGDTSAYASASEARLALCSMLAFWCGPDTSRVDALFRRSALYAANAEKWDRLGEKTVAQAVANKTDFFEPKLLRAAVATAPRTVTVDTPAVDVPAPEPEGPEPDLLVQLCGDVGNAHRLIALHGANLRYCPAYRNWLTWDGRRWRKDDPSSTQARRLAHTTMQRYLVQAARASNQDHAKFAAACLNTQRVSNCLREAQPNLVVQPDQLDQQHDLLNCRNGTLDLRTGELHPHRREDLITRLVHCDYVPDAECPTFTAYLERVAANHRGLLTSGYLQRMFGYGLTGHTSEKIGAFLLTGPTNTGKTTLLQVLYRLLHEYAARIRIETLMTRHDAMNSNALADLADLCGARYVVTSETSEGQRLNVGLLKSLSQGQGTIKAVRKYENPIEFAETHKLFIDANYLPDVPSTDDSIWNRLHAVPFDNPIPADEQDKTLPARLGAEAAGILAWAVAGAQRWYAQGLQKSQAVAKASAVWRSSNDQIARFIDECCCKDPDREVRARELYTAYRNWAEENGERPISEPLFAKRMEEQGYTKQRSKIGVRYTGIALAAAAPME